MHLALLNGREQVYGSLKFPDDKSSLPKRARSHGYVCSFVQSGHTVRASMRTKGRLARHTLRTALHAHKRNLVNNERIRRQCPRCTTALARVASLRRPPSLGPMSRGHIGAQRR